MTEVQRRTIEQLLAEHPFFAGVDPDLVAELTGCSRNVHVSPDNYLFRADDRAQTFFVLRTGRVALELPGLRGGPMTVETVDAGSIVGLDWLAAPYHHYLDGRAVEQTSAVAVDAGCLQAACERDPRLGYVLLQRVASQMYQLLQSSQLRLLDMYGVP